MTERESWIWFCAVGRQQWQVRAIHNLATLYWHSTGRELPLPITTFEKSKLTLEWNSMSTYIELKLELGDASWMRRESNRYAYGRSDSKNGRGVADLIPEIVAWDAERRPAVPVMPEAMP